MLKNTVLKTKNIKNKQQNIKTTHNTKQTPD